MRRGLQYLSSSVTPSHLYCIFNPRLAHQPCLLFSSSCSVLKRSYITKQAQNKIPFFSLPALSLPLYIFLNMRAALVALSPSFNPVESSFFFSSSSYVLRGCQNGCACALPSAPSLASDSSVSPSILPSLHHHQSWPSAADPMIMRHS